MILKIPRVAIAAADTQGGGLVNVRTPLLCSSSGAPTGTRLKFYTRPDKPDKPEIVLNVG